MFSAGFNGDIPDRAAELPRRLGKDNRLLIVQCLANFGDSGSPILADFNGIPAVVGVFSAFHEETGLMFAPSASQFEAVCAIRLRLMKQIY
jgi:hypothetical protein